MTEWGEEAVSKLANALDLSVGLARTLAEQLIEYADEREQDLAKQNAHDVLVGSTYICTLGELKLGDEPFALESLARQWEDEDDVWTTAALRYYRSLNDEELKQVIEEARVMESW